jgi:hypothetical protein
VSPWVDFFAKIIKDSYENIFPSLLNIDWELPYIAGILLIGIAFAFILNRNKQNVRA